jgi:hypothetical protein
MPLLVTRTNSPEEMIRYKNFWWEFAEFHDARNNETSHSLVRGPICIKKGCLGDMEEYERQKFRCMLCGEKQEIDIDGSRLNQLASAAYRAKKRKCLKFTNLDDLPSINERLEEKNKFYEVTIEHDDKGSPRDIHILIGRKDNQGKHAHIIISPDAEVRLDKKDLNPKEEIKSMGFIIYK